MAKNQIYTFGGFRLDPLRRLLFGSDGQPIALKPKVFETLLYLVEHAGAVLSKTELMEKVWGSRIVEENSLSKHISTLRHALGEAPGEHRFIVTEPGHGYRFVAKVETEAWTEPESPNARTAVFEASQRRFGVWQQVWYTLLGIAGVVLMLAAGRIISESAGDPRPEAEPAEDARTDLRL